MIYLELFLTFFVIGIFTIGGGYAMLSLIQFQVVTAHEWISGQAFTDIVAISQMTPGPVGINAATYIGYSALQQAGNPEWMCVLGSFTATSAIVLPSFLIVLTLCRAYSKFSGNNIFQGLMAGLRPAAVGLIGAAAILLITPDNFPDMKSWFLFAAALAVSLIWKLSPIIVIVAGGIAGYILY